MLLGLGENSLGCLSKPEGSGTRYQHYPLSTLAEKRPGKDTGVSWPCRLGGGCISQPLSFSAKPSPTAGSCSSGWYRRVHSC